jgi:hypothetical protein
LNRYSRNKVFAFALAAAILLPELSLALDAVQGTNYDFTYRYWGTTNNSASTLMQPLFVSIFGAWFFYRKLQDRFFSELSMRAGWRILIWKEFGRGVIRAAVIYCSINISGYLLLTFLGSPLHLAFDGLIEQKGISGKEFQAELIGQNLGANALTNLAATTLQITIQSAVIVALAFICLLEMRSGALALVAPLLLYTTLGWLCPRLPVVGNFLNPLNHVFGSFLFDKPVFSQLGNLAWGSVALTLACALLAFSMRSRDRLEALL